jgi:hypothetical protein
MLKRPSARDLVNAALGKQLSPKAQASLDDLRASMPTGRDTLDTENDMSDPIFLPEPELDNEESEDAEAQQPNQEGRPAQDQPADPARLSRKLKLLELITARLEEAKSGKSKSKKSKSTPNTRAESNRKNSADSTGPKTAEGKARVSANALKTGFFAHVERLNPADSTSYQDAIDDLRMGLHPEGPVEEQLIRELAMFRARLLRLEAAEYALICSSIETDPTDARELAAAHINNSEALERLSKAEVHLRRAYNRTWDRLERMQKERRKMPFQEAIKQSQTYGTYEAKRTTCLKCAERDHPNVDPSQAWKRNVPPPHPDLDENGNLKKYSQGHPLYRCPKK